MALSVSQLKERLAELLEVPKKETENILWALNEVCSETVASGETLTLPGIGKLSCNVRPARKARNPRTGESVQVPAKVAVKFNLSKSLKDQAPSLKSKGGKRLLEEAEAKQEAAAKRKRKKEREAAKAESSVKEKKKSSKNKSSSKKIKSSKRV